MMAIMYIQAVLIHVKILWMSLHYFIFELSSKSKHTITCSDAPRYMNIFLANKESNMYENMRDIPGMHLSLKLDYFLWNTCQ